MDVLKEYTENFEVIRDKSLIFRKYKIYVDVSFKDGDIVLGQKLSSFFGQIGVFENTDIIINFIGDYYKSLFLNDFMFSKSELEFIDEEIVDKEFIVYLPLTLIFYFGEKKIDFFVSSSWNKNFFFRNLKSNYIQTYSFFLKKKKSLFNNLNFYCKILEYNFLIGNFFHNTNYKSKLNLLIDQTSLKYFTDEDLYTLYFDEYFNYKYKKKKRIFFIKKIKLKNKKILINLNNKLFNISLNYLFYYIFIKLSFFDNNFNDLYLYLEYISFFSKVYNFKNIFFKRFSRRKKFKKTIIKNGIGKKFVFYKIFNSIEDTKKKKKR